MNVPGPPDPGARARPTAALDAKRLAILFDLARSFVALTALDELLPLVIDGCRRALNAYGVAVLLSDDDGQSVSVPFVVGAEPAQPLDDVYRIRRRSDRGIVGDVLRSGMAELIVDVQRDPRFDEELARAVGFTIGSLLAAPLVTPVGPVGLLIAITRRGEPPLTAADLAFVEALASSIAIAIENGRLYDRLRESEQRLRGEVKVLRRGLRQRDEMDRIVGDSAVMAGVLALVESAARSPVSVLVEGETGTGKELVARRIHGSSARAAAPFVAVHCAALPESLLESELFGHRRGAFTGADRDRAGLFETASGGTIFLDEVGEMPWAMQAKLLRVLQEGEVLRVGDDSPRPIDVRLISATNRDLEAEVRGGGFRPDLFYRLAAFPIRVPPLRERREDIPALIDHLLADSIARHGKRVAGITAAARRMLQELDWPGNVRQLQNELARAVALAHTGDVIDVEHLTSHGTSARGDEGADVGSWAQAAGVVVEAVGGEAAGAGGLRPLREARAEFEQRWIQSVLDDHGGNVTRAARTLGLSRVALHKRLASALRR